MLVASHADTDVTKVPLTGQGGTHIRLLCCLPAIGRWQRAATPAGLQINKRQRVVHHVKFETVIGWCVGGQAGGCIDLCVAQATPCSAQGRHRTSAEHDYRGDSAGWASSTHAPDHACILKAFTCVSLTSCVMEFLSVAMHIDELSLYEICREVGLRVLTGASMQQHLLRTYQPGLHVLVNKHVVPATHGGVLYWLGRHGCFRATVWDRMQLVHKTQTGTRRVSEAAPRPQAEKWLSRWSCHTEALLAGQSARTDLIDHSMILPVPAIHGPRMHPPGLCCLVPSCRPQRTRKAQSSGDPA
jgi:hypothetical protein